MAVDGYDTAAENWDDTARQQPADADSAATTVRDDVVRFRVSRPEKTRIEQDAAAAGYSGYSDYLRALTLPETTPDPPETAVRAAAEVRMRQHGKKHGVTFLTVDDFVPEAREILQAAWPFTGHADRNASCE